MSKAWESSVCSASETEKPRKLMEIARHLRLVDVVMSSLRIEKEK